MGSGKFYYPDGATYEGQYKLTGLPPPVPEAPAKKGAAAKKKEEEAPPQPLEPPKRVRHGTGRPRLQGNRKVLQRGHALQSAAHEWCSTPQLHCCFVLPGTYRSGDYVYEGEWMDDRICGQGRFMYASGSVYEGQWLNDKYQGKGRYSWPDGRAYEVSSKTSRGEMHCMTPLFLLCCWHGMGWWSGRQDTLCVCEQQRV